MKRLDEQFPGDEIAASVESWIAKKEWSGDRPESIRDYRSVMKNLREALPVDATLADLDGGKGADVLFIAMQKRWGKQKARTRNKVTSYVRDWTGYLEKFDFIHDSPGPRLDRVRTPRSERKAHSLDVVHHLLSCQDRTRDRVGIMAGCYQGWRRNEIRFMRWQDVNLAEGSAFLLGAKGGKAVHAKLLPSVKLEFERLALEENPQPHHYILYPARTVPNGVGEVAIKDNPFSEAGFFRWWRKCLVRAGFREETFWPFHETRHTAATLMWMAGRGNLKVAQAFLRHQSVQTTGDTYIHMPTGEYMDALLALDDLVTGEAVREPFPSYPKALED